MVTPCLMCFTSYPVIIPSTIISYIRLFSPNLMFLEKGHFNFLSTIYYISHNIPKSVIYKVFTFQYPLNSAPLNILPETHSTVIFTKSLIGSISDAALSFTNHQVLLMELRILGQHITSLRLPSTFHNIPISLNHTTHSYFIHIKYCHSHTPYILSFSI